MVVASFVQGFFSEPMKQLGHSGIKKYIKISSASERLTQEIWETVRTGYPGIDDLWVSDKEYPYRAWLTERTSHRCEMYQRESRCRLGWDLLLS